MVVLRQFQPDDAPALLALFRDTVRRVNSRDYSPAQVTAWASDEIDPVAWAERFSGRYAVVAELRGRAVGFADLRSDGQLDRLFVSADHQGEGIGGLLVAELIAEARRQGMTRLLVEASVTARQFFESQGFTVLAQQLVMCRGEEFVNYRMERHLG